MQHNPVKNNKNSEAKATNQVELEDKIWLLNSTKNLRRIVGGLGMLLPVLLWFWILVKHSEPSPLPSISHYHFTSAAGLFAIVLGLIGIFLIVYRYENYRTDHIVSTIAGIAALGVVLIPTGNLSDYTEYQGNSIVITRISESREGWHYAFAGVFLMSLTFMSYYLFTKSNKEAGKRSANKVIRNRIFRTCAAVMLLALIVIISNPIADMDYFKHSATISNWPKYYEELKLTFYMETIAVLAFGFSWLIKGKTLFAEDK